MLTDEEKKARLGLVTSSVAADVMEGRVHVAYRKIMGLEQVPYTHVMKRGDKLEPVLLQWSAEELGEKLGYELTATKPTFRRHPTHTWAGDSCDVHYRDTSGRLDYIGEIKTAGMGVSRQYGEEGTDEVPRRALYQCHWHLLHHPEVEVCVLPRLGGWDLTLDLFYVQRDSELEGLMVQAGERFYRDYILPNKEPPADGDASTTAWFNQRPRSDDVIDATPEMVALAEQYQAAKKNEKTFASEASAAANQLKRLLGSASCARLGDFQVKLTTVAASSYTVNREAYKRLAIKGVK